MQLVNLARKHLPKSAVVAQIVFEDPPGDLRVASNYRYKVAESLDTQDDALQCVKFSGEKDMTTS
jgi:hypothetical protein